MGATRLLYLLGGYQGSSMTACQIQAAARYAFPRGPTAVEDRRMSLDTNCREESTHSTKLFKASTTRARTGAAVQEFHLCENHSQLVAQVDRELIEEGWTTAFSEKPQFMA